MVSNSKCELESLSKKSVDNPEFYLYKAMGKYHWHSRDRELSLSIRTTTLDLQSAR